MQWLVTELMRLSLRTWKRDSSTDQLPAQMRTPEARCIAAAIVWAHHVSLGDARDWQGAGPQERPPMRTTPKNEGYCISPNGGHPEGVFLLRGRQPLCFRWLVGLLRSRSYRAIPTQLGNREPVDLKYQLQLAENGSLSWENELNIACSVAGGSTPFGKRGGRDIHLL
jgi:hypothetical protein